MNTRPDATLVDFAAATGAESVANALSRLLLVSLLFSAATAAFFWDWLPYLHSALIGPPEDNMQDFWNTWYVAFRYQPGHFSFTDLIRFPEGTPLTYHSFAYPQVFAVALVSKIFGLGASTLLLQQNVSLLLSFPLAGIGAFYLVRHLTGSTAGALLGGFVFAFNPSHVAHVMHHAHVSQIEFIPFFVLTFLLTIERRSVPLLLASIVLFVLNALSCWYYLFYVAYFIVFHTAYVAIRDRSWPNGWRLIAPVACLAGTVAVLSPLLVPMMARAASGGTSVYAQGNDLYVANVVGYVAFPPQHLLGGLTSGIYSRLSTNFNEWEGIVYLGLVNVFLIAWLWFKGRDQDRRLLRYVLSGLVVFCIFCSGDSLHIMRHHELPMPDLVLSHLPFFKNTRNPSRAIVFVYLFLAIGVGAAAAFAWNHLPRRAGRWAVLAASTLIVLDFLPVRHLPMTPLVCSPGLAQIRDDPERGFGVLDLPSGKPFDIYDYLPGNVFMFQQTCHGRPIAQGNTSRNLVVSLRDRLETDDMVVQRRQLVDARIKYIVINHKPMGIELPWRDSDGRQDGYLSAYTIVYDAPDLTILRVY